MFHHKTFVWFIGGVALLLLGGSMFWFTQDFFRLYQGGPLDPANRPPLPKPLKTQEWSRPKETLIEPWMTFWYVSKVYNIPTDYMKKTLNIQVSDYPNVTVGAVARSQNIPPRIFVAQVVEIVGLYLTEQKPQ